MKNGRRLLSSVACLTTLTFVVACGQAKFAREENNNRGALLNESLQDQDCPQNMQTTPGSIGSENGMNPIGGNGISNPNSLYPNGVSNPNAVNNGPSSATTPLAGGTVYNPALDGSGNPVLPGTSVADLPTSNPPIGSGNCGGREIPGMPTNPYPNAPTNGQPGIPMVNPGQFNPGQFPGVIMQ